MFQYVYKTVIDYPDNSDKIDFETYYKATAKGFTEFDIGDNVFILELTYTNFKSLIDGVTITWGDVRYIVNTTNGLTMYELYLITNNAL